TSSGKTVVAEYAIFRALAEGTRAIYTTPLKALSNQKFRDFVKAYGADKAGLVTGENSVNDGAPIVVMTTEILRNLIYEDPDRLRDVRYVILDEVHYIDDFPRGSVWEEIIVQAPHQIKMIGLSATIGNYQEIADWMTENRGPVGTVFQEQRPVELKLWLSIQNKLHPLFRPDLQVDQRTWSKASEDEETEYRVRRFRQMPSNDLLQVIPELAQRQMLPAIYFIFSRRGCLEALQRCSYHGFDLTTDEEKELIDEVCHSRLSTLRDPDEAALYNRVVDGSMMRAGLAVHHAGLLPYHKELVEELFQMGLLKVVFATETLALGINMPARAVAISSFTKFDGVNFSNLTTGELTQLMGRAGRRGIDTLGHGVILKESDVEVGTIYEVAMGEGLVVQSKFLPNYNMALNLLRIYTPDEADALMDRSFGQFQKRLAAVRTTERMGNVRARLADVRSMWDCSTCSITDMERYFKIEERRRVIRIEMRRLRREEGAAGRRGGHGRNRAQRQSVAGKQITRLELESRELVNQQRALPVVRCPNFTEHLGKFGELRRLEDDLKGGERELGSQIDEYARKLRRLRRVLSETGFIAQDRPTEKGMLASRVYGENTLLVTEALWQGWMEGLSTAEICAVLVMLSAEDRSRDRGPRTPRRYPSPAVAQTARLVRSLYFRFSDIEHDLDEPNLRQPSHDYIDFAYRWASGDPLDQIPLPPGVDIGDAIKAMRALYSVLRQLDWALKEIHHPLRATFRASMEAMERDVIKRT
ncbi:MAG TPA: DEAD/DEAH box helicase, partial [Candidatus Dormibacteraeota bacterium]|nr:DEAD/DEAH box helicase [Candidatus Dormibacteraeota bacterium]